MTENNKFLLKEYGITEIKPALIPYFCYYASQYTPEPLGDCLIFEIPYNDGSKKLDNYFINILTGNGWTISDNFLLHRFYLLKTI